MPDANVGVNVPLLRVRLAKLALFALVTVNVYVNVAPVCAVPTMVMVLAPTAKVMAAEGFPEVTGVPFTVTVAVLSASVGVTVMLLIEFGTLSTCVVDTVCRFERPPLVVNDARVLFDERASFTTNM